MFTKHLLEALNGKADTEDYGNGDGKVTLGELQTYLDDEMTLQARAAALQPGPEGLRTG